MAQVSLKIIEKVLFDVKAEKKGATPNKIIYKVKNVVVVIPSSGMDLIHFMDMLRDQLDMDWWMIDYILGQNGLM